MQLSSITQKGQVTIPVQIRQLLMLHRGDQVEFAVHKNKIILTKHTQPVEALFGMYKIKHKVSDADIKKAILKGAMRADHT